MTIKAGDKIPSATLYVMTADGPDGLSTDELFGGKKVAMFGLPGAFTPTCSAQHVPSYLSNAAALKEKGIDTIICLSVNDAFVMGAWGKDQGVGDTIVMAGDGAALFSKAMGLDMDLTERGMGVRCQRFSMVVTDGVVTVLNHEAPGEYRVSSAEAMLEQL
ncbi:MAG: peroxiredoxin [Rhodospirillaceae bacterium]|jgi:glutaredoxin/glutathione-dependent peroxiredoxin|nr:peroxiredoxin [Rhodospirillaceae bacterium]MBT5243496.1 peroxiredoxin [Rhodospirillaceae bacterium]MBT5562084.1 peroxiredoxin [Rhodospirillaceae bacterium]MBT6242257.1 peroxiredoxin [Rhodospirillaceae bacterium]MBT7136919.1 peroxiredoxin [Rhodospirillaceae bacterium]